jgi:hypothetical protein
VRHPLRCPAMGAISGHIQDPAAGIVLSRETGDVPTVHPGAAQIDVGVLQVGKSLRVRPDPAFCGFLAPLLAFAGSASSLSCAPNVVPDDGTLETRKERECI